MIRAPPRFPHPFITSTGPRRATIRRTLIMNNSHPIPQPSHSNREIAKWRKRAIQNRDSLDYYRGKAQRLTEENYALRNHSDAAPDMHAEIVWLKQQLETANETAESWADRALTAERNYRDTQENR